MDNPVIPCTFAYAPLTESMSALFNLSGDIADRWPIHCVNMLRHSVVHIIKGLDGVGDDSVPIDNACEARAYCTFIARKMRSRNLTRDEGMALFRETLMIVGYGILATEGMKDVFDAYRAYVNENECY
ncbi:hypothetical protein KIPB_006304 [Kipferlia bialata]|uniref:Uncharacterized protein n=1 Tax=Kipferlia bialata TaxID=797122 RepID=A0A391NM79_9EUKA|nr:hypothetical protein KIPB_006304 [Kipferlia bialata]|eukprot:g6304.t1